jgi:hypothetical protein
MQGLELITGQLESSGLALEPGQVDLLLQVFPAEDFFMPPKQVLQAEVGRDSRGHFNIIHQHSALRADCYFPGRSELARRELAHRRRLSAPFGDAWFAPPEAVIVSKLLFYREGRSAKHLEDIGAMLAAGSVPDRAVLLSWIVRLGLGAEWSGVAG